jgi:hypothetical protein
MNYRFPSTERLRLQRGAEYLHRLGSRPVFELLAEISCANGCLPDMLDRLDRYRAITPETVRALGDDRFPVAVFEVRL